MTLGSVLGMKLRLNPRSLFSCRGPKGGPIGGPTGGADRGAKGRAGRGLRCRAAEGRYWALFYSISNLLNTI